MATTHQRRPSLRRKIRRKRHRRRQTDSELIGLTPQSDSATLQRVVANPSSASAADILSLQRAYGNRAVSALVQAKLTVGPVGDHCEQEADRVAQQVVNRLYTPMYRSLTEDPVQRQNENDRQSKPDRGDVAPRIEKAVQSARGSGQSLPDPVRRPMEKTFGADLGGVRVHHNDQADALNRALGARAFTTQQDIFFRRGEYDSKSRKGQKLIAHELTHVVQQSGNVSQRNGLFQNKATHPSDGVIQREISEDQFISETTSSFLGCIKWRVGEQADLDIMQAKLRAFEGAKGVVDKVSKLDDLVGQAGALNKRGKADKFKAALLNIIEQARDVRYALTQEEEYKQYERSLKVKEQREKEAEEARLLGKEYSKATEEERNHRLAQYKEQNPGQAALLENINGSLTEEGVLRQLLSNFWSRRDFTYTFSSSSPFQGSGDCQTLRNEYMLIARDALGIKLDPGDEEEPMFVAGGGRIIDSRGLVGNVDRGAHWLFENHHWVIWHGTPIDVLYGLFGEMKASVKGEELKNAPWIGYKFGDIPVYVRKDRGPGNSYTLDREQAEKNPFYRVRPAPSKSFR